MIGCVTDSVLAGDREVEGQAAIVLWAGRFGPVETYYLDVDGDRDVEGRLEGQERSSGATDLGGTADSPLGRIGLPEDGKGGTLVLIADPHTFPTRHVLDLVAGHHPGLTVVGGMVSAGPVAGSNRLVIDGTVRTSGAVAALIPPDVATDAVVSQGCRPVGEPLTVTAADGNVVHAIAGQAATDRLRQALATAPTIELHEARNGLHLGRVVDQHRLDIGRGDFLVRAVLAVDPTTGSVTVADHVSIGDTVQFQLRNSETADEDLRVMVGGRTAGGGLVFTCNGRGLRLFGTPDHDAEVVSSLLGTTDIAGMFCAGEVGPVGDRSFVHGYSASVLMFDPD
jgi:small ligand-binding sensory domain FIST